MNAQLILGLLLTMTPIFELRGGLPIVMDYVVKNNLPVLPYFIMVLVLNILVIIFAFVFFDFLHKKFMGGKWYRKVVGRMVNNTRTKAKKVQSRMDRWGYFALMLFVAVPIPGTGAWTGTTVAWILGLNRIKSFIAIAIGVTIAGLIILLISLGLLNWFH